MEEWVGQAWHKLITRASRTSFPHAEVTLEEIRKPAALLFRALGGDGGLRLEAATETAHSARRKLLSRIAGSDVNVELAWREPESLRLPIRLAWLPRQELNRELYLWLAALAAQQPSAILYGLEDWLSRNALASADLIEAYPGLAGRYRRLVDAHLEQRPDPAQLPPAERAQEQLIREALEEPATYKVRRDVLEGVKTRYRPAPVPLWLHPGPPVGKKDLLERSEDGESGGQDENTSEIEPDKRRRGERVDEPEGKGGLIAFRLESLFSRAEYVAVDRTQEENEDEDAKSSIEDLDVLSMSRDRNRTGAKLRFDLDLPSAEYDDICLGDGIPLPEWDYKKQTLIPDYCRLQPMLARDIEKQDLPVHLHSKARRLRNLFETLKPRRIWQSGQPDGSEMDTNALIRQMTDRLRGNAASEADIYRDFRNLERDLSCLVLADLSLSTDAHVDNDQRVIDVIRDSLHLFAEALVGTGDRFALYGFSSRHRDHIRFHTLKTFEEPHGGEIRGRINAIKPGYYTRMGAAIRYASALLEKEPSSQKLLMILTDGKPNDLDKYESRYGVEDTRAATREAVRKGLQPFCVTIDKKAGEYLPYLFGSRSFVLLRDARELPAKLPALYARLTA